MAKIDDLISKIDNRELRLRIEQEVAKMQKQRKFGLVFEEHLPECTPLFDIPVKRGATVALKSGKISDNYVVTRITGDKATCERLDGSHKISEFAVNDLVVVAQFGEPIYPFLKKMGTVQNTPDSDLWHTLIEADNYHALQLLVYLYAGQVDCIYLDPPYNTGAHTWKYNNNYVDNSDSYRHSKWLSMMDKRLKLAKKLLSPTGALIITIDDNEYAHLYMILESIFPEYKKDTVSILINPRGPQSDKIAVTNEFAIIVYTDKSTFTRKKYTGDDVSNLRKWGGTSYRYEGATCFYPIILNSKKEIIGFGDVLDDNEHPTNEVELLPDGNINVWPIDTKNVERKWRYSRDTVESIQKRLSVVQKEDRIEIYIDREDEALKTMWIDDKYNAETYGTKIISKIIGKDKFSYPKSLYAVSDIIRYFITDKKDALILDFFAGSGTTLHAVNLINVEDNGHRRCILVTNNEVSEKEAKTLTKQGHNPGDNEWEKLGIARYVTWPRTECSIKGVDVNNKPLEGYYFTNETKDVAKKRTVKQLSVDVKEDDVQLKKQIVSLINDKDLPASNIEKDSAYLTNEDAANAILFDSSAIDDFIEEIGSNVETIFVATADNKTFKSVKSQLAELPPIVKNEVVTIPMSDGFKANAIYFKLGFLNKTNVSLGREFARMLSLLWMKAGAHGICPELTTEVVPGMLILPENQFAVLNDESLFMDFAEKVNADSRIKCVFIITDSNSAYREMISNINIRNTFQLYRDYLDNFRINQSR